MPFLPEEISVEFQRISVVSVYKKIKKNQIK